MALRVKQRTAGFVGPLAQVWRRSPLDGLERASLRLRSPEVLGEPVEAERLQRRRQGLPGLAVVADFAVPGVDHLLPLFADGLALGRTVDRRGAVPRPRTVQVAREAAARSEEHTSELQSQSNLVCRLLLEKKNWSCPFLRLQG